MGRRKKRGGRRAALLLLSVLALAGLGAYAARSVDMQTYVAPLASVFGIDPVSVLDLYRDYQATSTQDRVRVLIVPGHEPDYGGAQFQTPNGTLYERNLVAELGADLQQYLQSGGKYKVFVTRSATAWNPIFADYFSQNWNAIVAWEQASKRASSTLASLGNPSVPPVEHITDPADVALRLYGITKWADENNIDVTIHLHLNDYPGHGAGTAGKYSGLVMYVPARQYNNSSTTQAIARTVFDRLALYNPIDNLPVESAGIIDDPELIAVGANNTAKDASMLIEYDYLYEPQFVNPSVRDLALKDLAYQTYLGLQDFFNKNTQVSVTDSYHPATLYAWNTPVNGPGANAEDIYALQTALLMDGDYPPAGKSANDCPRSGIFGACTRAAVAEFQRKYGITGESAGGPETFAKLQRVYDQ